MRIRVHWENLDIYENEQEQEGPLPTKTSRPSITA